MKKSSPLRRYVNDKNVCVRVAAGKEGSRDGS